MSFWQVFITLMIFIPLVMLWLFTLIDLFQRTDLSGMAKALWAIAVVLLPLIGMLVYFIVRDSSPPTGPDQEEPLRAPSPPPNAVDVADQLERLADLRGKGILSDEEFQREKDKLLGHGTG